MADIEIKQSEAEGKATTLTITVPDEEIVNVEFKTVFGTFRLEAFTSAEEGSAGMSFWPSGKVKYVTYQEKPDYHLFLVRSFRTAMSEPMSDSRRIR